MNSRGGDANTSLGSGIAPPLDAGVVGASLLGVVLPRPSGGVVRHRRGGLEILVTPFATAEVDQEAPGNGGFFIAR